MKLTGQASQYWTKCGEKATTLRQEPIDTWSYMKDELKGKYMPPHYYKHLDRWRKIFQGNKSAKEYVTNLTSFSIVIIS